MCYLMRRLRKRKQSFSSSQVIILKDRQGVLVRAQKHLLWPLIMSHVSMLPSKCSSLSDDIGHMKMHSEFTYTVAVKKRKLDFSRFFKNMNISLIFHVHHSTFQHAFIRYECRG